MIVVWGARSDPPVTHVLLTLVGRGADVVHVDHLVAVGYDVTLSPSLGGWFELCGRRIDVDESQGCMPAPTTPTSVRASTTASALAAVASALPVPVVNRPVAGRSNWSKPFQLTLLARSRVRSARDVGDVGSLRCSRVSRAP